LKKTSKQKSVLQIKIFSQIYFRGSAQGEVRLKPCSTFSYVMLMIGDLIFLGQVAHSLDMFFPSFYEPLRFQRFCVHSLRQNQFFNFEALGGGES
jgi:hypothetical protein